MVGVTVARSQNGTWNSWRFLVTAAGVVEAALLGAGSLNLHDQEPAALAVAVVIGVGLSRIRRGIIGTAILAVLFVNVAVWTVPETASNFIQHQGLLPLAIPLALATTALTGLVAVGALARRRSAPATRWTRIIGLAAVTFVVVVLALGAALGGPASYTLRPGDVTLQAENAKFSDTALAASSGDVTVYVSNRDLFWHTFTIDALGVNEPVPVGSEHQVTFKAPQGTYTFYCAIPGHAAIGMRGTLTIR